MAEPLSAPRPSLEGTFDCNICLETASDPVVTLCGHLYCWGCIYKWLELREGPQCPICKAEIARERMVPIYGRGRPHVDPRCRADFPKIEEIPDRPAAASRAPAAAPASEGAGRTTAAVASSALSSAAATAESGFDVMASLFGLRIVSPASHPTQARGALSREEEQQAFLSRLLLLLGSFVILCLLLF
jgi:E3 ubiquitin-protein ligase RNF5